MRIRRNETIVKHVSSPQFMPTSQHELTCDDKPKILQPTTWDKKKHFSMISSNIGISVVMYSKAEATLEDHESSVRQAAADQQKKGKVLRGRKIISNLYSDQSALPQQWQISDRGSAA